MSGSLIVVRTIADLRTRVAEWRRAGDRIGLVPTMGALHDGHLTLVHAAREVCQRVIVTLFVNPRQFGPNEDFARYPRSEADDVAKLEGRADLLFAPGVDEMYPPGFATGVSVAGVTDGLCGAGRPGHFDGVATVVTKLLLQAQPDVALFGEKDYQQLCTIRRFVRDLDIPVAIQGVPTVREVDGLALSSRNRYLSAAERAAAPALYRILGECAARLVAGDPAGQTLAAGGVALQAAGFGPIDYLELRSGDDLRILDALVEGGPPARLLVAARLGKTRLIDNLAVIAAA